MPLKKPQPLFVILFTIFIDLVGIGILIPVIPQLLANPESSEYLLPTGMSLESGYILLGALVAAYPFAQFLAAPILGQLSDRYGRRPVLIASLFGTAIGYGLFALAIMTRNLPLLFAARILDGITGGNLPVAQAAIADVTTPENRAKNFGLMGAAFGFGFIVGPFLGGVLSDGALVSWFNATTPFWFAGALALVNMTLIALFLNETSPGSSIEPLHWAQSLKHIVKAFSHPKLRSIFLVGFLFFSGFAFFTTLFGVFLIDRYGFSESDTGNFFAYVGIWIVFTQVFVTPRVAKKWRERLVLNVTLIATGIALVLFHLPGPWTIMLLIVPVFAIFNGLTQSNYMAFLSRSAGADVQGEVLGINASVGALSQAIPPMLSGYIAAQFDPAMTLYVASGIMLVAGILFISIVRHDPQTPVTSAAVVAH